MAEQNNIVVLTEENNTTSLTDSISYKQNEDGSFEFTVTIPSPTDCGEELLEQAASIAEELGPVTRFIDVNIVADKLADLWLNRATTDVCSRELPFDGQAWLCLGLMFSAARIAMSCEKQKAVAKRNRPLEGLIEELDGALGQKFGEL